MAVELRRVPGAPMAQTVRIRAHNLVADGSVEEGGTDSGPSPHDLYDAALGACKALTVLWYARRKGLPVDDVQTVVERDASAERAGVYRLATRLQVSGDLTDAQIAELETVAQKCPVHKLMTTVTTEISTVAERAARAIPPALLFCPSRAMPRTWAAVSPCAACCPLCSARPWGPSCFSTTSAR